MRRSGCALGLLMLGMAIGAGLLGIALVGYNRHQAAVELDRQLNDQDPILPRWARLTRPCLPPSLVEVDQDRAMLATAAAFSGDSGLFSGASYAFSYFGWQWAIDGRLDRCAPDPALYATLAPIVERAGWPAAQVDGSELDLAEHLPPGKRLAERLAALAFSAYPLFNSPLKYDNRPYARMLLGDQGPYALPWKAQALRQIAAETRLGTGAAYLAVAIASQEALPRVAATLRRFTAIARARKMNRTEDDGPQSAFTWQDGKRLTELAYAISVAGPRAQPWAGAVTTLLDDRFAYPAPPFGLLFLPPRDLCLVAAHIGGRAAAAARARPFCATARFWHEPGPVSKDAPTR